VKELIKEYFNFNKKSNKADIDIVYFWLIPFLVYVSKITFTMTNETNKKRQLCIHCT
jgi:hypothetical protein